MSHKIAKLKITPNTLVTLTILGLAENKYTQVTEKGNCSNIKYFSFSSTYSLNVFIKPTVKS